MSQRKSILMLSCCVLLIGMLQPAYGADEGKNVNPVLSLLLSGGACSSGAQTVMWKGKEWQRSDDGNRYNWYQASGTFHVTDNPNSIDVCGDLVLDGSVPTGDCRPRMSCVA